MEVTYRRPPWLIGSYHPRSTCTSTTTTCRSARCWTGWKTLSSSCSSRSGPGGRSSGLIAQQVFNGDSPCARRSPALRGRQKMRPYLAVEGDDIFSEGEIGGEMYMVLRGEIKLSSRSHQLYGVRNWSDGAFFGELSGPPWGVSSDLGTSIVNRFCMVLLYGRVGRVTAKNGGFRRGQAGARHRRRPESESARLHRDGRGRVRLLLPLAVRARRDPDSLAALQGPHAQVRP